MASRMFSSVCTMLVILVASLFTGSAEADNEIRITYTASGRATVVEYDDADQHTGVFKPGLWDEPPVVTTWSAKVEAAPGEDAKATSVRTINIQGATNDNITVRVTTNTGSSALSAYGLKDCEGIRLNTDSNLDLYATLYGDLKGDIRTNDPLHRPINYINLQCVGTITANRLIKGIHVEFVRAHKIEGGVTVEAVAGTNSKIRLVRTGYVDGERTNVPTPSGGWPTMSAMDIGASGSPVTLRTPSGVGLTQSVVSMDDLYVTLDIGGHATELRDAPLASGEAFNYSSGTLTHRMQVTGDTATLGNVYASAAGGGYLDTASDYLFITSSTTDYAGTMASVSGGSGANEIDFRGRLWFNAGIALATTIRLSDDMNGEMIFNAANNQRLWSASSSMVIDGTNISSENPAYSLVTTGGGTVGMVDGVNNNLGFHLHVEECYPPSGSGGTNEIDLSNWRAGTEWIDLVFYGPVRLEGESHHVDLQRYDDSSEEWVSVICIVGTPAETPDALLYDLEASGDNTSLNILHVTACPLCPCTLPLGEYRIVEMEDGLKADLGLQSDPDVQPFEYYFTLID